MTFHGLLFAACFSLFVMFVFWMRQGAVRVLDSLLLGFLAYFFLVAVVLPIAKRLYNLTGYGLISLIKWCGQHKR